MDTRTGRALIVNGGGTKGYGQLHIIERMATDLNMTVAEFIALFDVIGGISIGGIVTCGLTYGIDVNTIYDIFLQKAKRIFTNRTATEVATFSHHASLDSNKVTGTNIAIQLATNTGGFYKSPYEDPLDDPSDFGSNILQSSLQEIFGNATMSAIQKPVVIGALRRVDNTIVNFSNFDDSQYFTGSNTSIVDVCRATSAAFPYLPAYEIDGYYYLDGAFGCNSITPHVDSLLRRIKPDMNRMILTELGSGKGHIGLDDDSAGIAITETLTLSNRLITGAENGVQHNYEFLNESSLGVNNIPLYYYKYNPVFPDTFPNDLDNSTAEWFAELLTYCDAQYSADSSIIATHLERLVA